MKDKKEIEKISIPLIRVRDFVLLEDDYNVLVTIKRRKASKGVIRWSVFYRTMIVDKNLKCNEEPMPSSRTEKFYKKYRFDITQALEIGNRLVKRLEKESFI